MFGKSVIVLFIVCCHVFFVPLHSQSSEEGSIYDFLSCNSSSIQGYKCSVEVSQEIHLDWFVNGTEVNFAFSVKTAGWIALAWSKDGFMIGSEAVVGFNSQSNESNRIRAYKLNGKDEAEVNPTTEVEIRDTSIAYLNGTTVMKFTREVTNQRTVPWSINGVTTLLYAYSISGSNEIGYHGSNKGGFGVNLSQAIEKSVNETSPAPAPTPAFFPDSIASNSSKNNQTPSQTNQFTQSSESNENVSTNFNTISRMLETHDFELYWNRTTQGMFFIASFATSGWVGMAWSPDGGMADSDAVLSNLENNPSPKTFHINGHSLNSIQSSSQFSISNASSEVRNGRTIMRFERKNGDGVVPTNDFGENFIIWAFSPTNSTTLGFHQANFGSKQINFDSINSFTATVAGSEGNDERKTFAIIHGWLMWAGFGVLLPLGIFFIRAFRNDAASPLRFRIHVLIQTIAWMIITASGIIALVKFKALDDIHGRLGLSALCLLWIQPVIGFLRPNPYAKARPFWYFLHWLIGVSCIVLSWITIFYGLKLYSSFISSSNIKLLKILFAVEIGILGFAYLVVLQLHHLSNLKRIEPKFDGATTANGNGMGLADGI